MPRLQAEHGTTKLVIVWPNKAEHITFELPEDEEESVNIEDLYPQAALIGSDMSPYEPPEDGPALLVVSYPEKIRFYLRGKRISLKEAHDSFVTFLIAAITAALEKE